MLNSFVHAAFATVEKAGHMVPYDQPVVALEMLQRTLEGRNLS